MKKLNEIIETKDTTVKDITKKVEVNEVNIKGNTKDYSSDKPKIDPAPR